MIIPAEAAEEVLLVLAGHGLDLLLVAGLVLTGSPLKRWVAQISG